jgi:hypothetical protein
MEKLWRNAGLMMFFEGVIQRKKEKEQAIS